MSKPLLLSIALTGTLTIAAAYPRSDLPSAKFEHKDWEIACDNTRTCRAAGYHVEDEAPNASLLLTRTAGPHAPVTAKLQLAQEGDTPAPPPSLLRMQIGGRDLGIVKVHPGSRIGVLSPAQVRALLPALLEDGQIGWRAGSKTWTISSAGANAVLIKMDAFQGRLETPGALVRRGVRPETGVLPPLPPPRIAAVPVGGNVQALTPAQGQTLLQALRKTVDQDDCDLLLDTKTGPESLKVQALAPDKMLVSAACWQGAYNTGDGYWVANRQAPYAPVLVTATASSYKDGVIASWQRGRGLGDCIALADWTWDGRSFAQTSAATTGMCRQIAGGGAWTLPTLVTAVKRSR